MGQRSGLEPESHRMPVAFGRWRLEGRWCQGSNRRPQPEAKRRDRARIAAQRPLTSPARKATVRGPGDGHALRRRAGEAVSKRSASRPPSSVIPKQSFPRTGTSIARGHEPPTCTHRHVPVIAVAAFRAATGGWPGITGTAGLAGAPSAARRGWASADPREGKRSAQHRPLAGAEASGMEARRVETRPQAGARCRRHDSPARRKAAGDASVLHRVTLLPREWNKPTFSRESHLSATRGGCYVG